MRSGDRSLWCGERLEQTMKAERKPKLKISEINGSLCISLCLSVCFPVSVFVSL